MLGSLGGVAGLRVGDLFAGTGALGIEALSRGAAHATFVDRSPAAVAAIRANLAATGLGGRAGVVRADAVRWAAGACPLDVVLCDPPYRFDGWRPLLDALGRACRLAVLESADAVDPGAGWRVLKVKRYGGTLVTVARPAGPPVAAADARGET